MKRLLILRPQPGAGFTEQRARALGLDPLTCPLFALCPVAWSPPPVERFDGLLLTSANVLRHAGPELRRLTALPVLAVGDTTAAAARAAGFAVERVGDGGVDDLLAPLGPRRLLHLCGDEVRDGGPQHDIVRIVTYRAEPIADPGLPDLDGLVIAVHSPRAGRRLAELAHHGRSSASIVAISPAAALAVGSGWKSVSAAAAPTDRDLLALAARLCQD